MKKIHFVRHGRTGGNEKGLWQTFDQKLSDFGREQAKKVAKKLKSIDVDIIIASDMDRAFETANIINTEVGKQVVPTKLLHEIHRPSVVRGKEKADPQVILIMDEVEKNWKNIEWKHSDEENFYDLKQRAINALNHLLELPEENIIAVSHEMFIRMLFSVICFGEQMTPELFENFVKVMWVENTSVSTFKYEDGKWKMLSWNDHSHLSC